MAGFVVEGVPVDPQDVREYDHPRYGHQRVMSFRVQHPKTGAVDPDRWSQPFEVSNALVDRVQECCKAGKLVRMVCSTEAKLSRAGKPYSVVLVTDLLD